MIHLHVALRRTGPTEPLRDEGPFGDHTGYCTLPEPYPVFHVTAITHRKDAVYPATIVGIPPMKDFYIGGASVKLFLPIFKMNFPEIMDLALPAEGVFHNLVFMSIKKTCPMQAYKSPCGRPPMHGLWGMGQLMFTKYLVVVDDDVNVHNPSEVLFCLRANTDLPSLEALAPDRSRLRFLMTGLLTASNHPLAALSFQTAPDASSGIVRLAPFAASAIDYQGTNLARAALHSGLVVLVNRDPVLLASAHPASRLVLFGRPGTNYVLEFTTNLLDHVTWQPFQSLRLTEPSASFEVSPSGPTLFFRAVEMQTP